ARAHGHGDDRDRGYGDDDRAGRALPLWSPSNARKPVLVEIDPQRIACRAVIAGPQFRLLELDLVERLGRHAVAAQGEELGIGERAERLRDDAFLAPDIDGR